jgi:hypothetical protein
MRTGILAAAAALTVFAPGVASAQGPWLPGCVGLTCVAPGSPDDVPQARNFVPSVAGPEQLQRQASAGFYEFGAGTDSGNRAVAYVVPFGQADRMPASVRDLPAAVALADAGIFERATVVLFEPHTMLIVPNPSTGSVAGTSRGTRPRARAANVDSYGCIDNYFCLYSSDGFWWPNPQVQFGADHTGEGWKSLANYSFNDWTQSMRNRRDRDSLLARHSDGSGIRYCADSHSSDTTLSNNAIGNRTASAFANVPDDIHC